MTSERECLLAAVAANPDADLPRLVYADWLEEHGEVARARFIRQQVAEWRDPAPWELSRTPRPSATVLQNHRAAWLPGLTANQREWVGFERGFPASYRPARLDAGALKPLDKPNGGLGPVTRLDLTAAPPAGLTPLGFARHPAAGRARELVLPAEFAVEALEGGAALNVGRLECVGYPWELRAALALPAPPGLRSLAFTSFYATPSSLARADFDRPPLLANLTELVVRGPVWGDPGALAALLAGPALPRAERLEIRAPGLARRRGDIGHPVAALDLPALRHLALEVGGPSARAVAIAPGGSRLESLSLLDPARPHRALARLLNCGALAGLRRLDVDTASYGNATDALAEYLLGSDVPLRLEKLFVGQQWQRDPRAAELREKYGPRLSLQTEPDLAATRRRLAR